MPTIDDLEQEISTLNDQIDGLKDQMKLRTEETEEELLKLSHQMRMGISQTNDNDELSDDMNALINSHLRDITAEQRPQMSSAGLEMYNKHFTNLTNHELHNIKKMKKLEQKIKPKTIMDESLGDIVDNCINFLTFSFENYNRKILESEEYFDKYEDLSFIDNIKTYSLATVLFIRDDRNIIYIGFILILFSIIIYFINNIITYDRQIKE